MEEYVNGLSVDELKQLKVLVTGRLDQLTNNRTYNWRALWKYVVDIMDPYDIGAKTGPDWERDLRISQYNLISDYGKFIKMIAPFFTEDQLRNTPTSDLAIQCREIFNSQLDPVIERTRERIREQSGQKIQVVYNPTTDKYEPQYI